MLSKWMFKKHLEDDEDLKRVVHKHWLFGAKALFWPTLWIATAALIVWINPARGMITVMGVLAFVFAIWWLRNFFDYFLDAWLVTDQGIVDIAWHGWFHRESSRVLYSDLQGISYEIQGVWGTLLQFGTISVEKISNGQTISMDHVKFPKKIEILVLQNMEQYLHKKNLKDSKQIQKLLATLVAEQMQLEELKASSGSDDE